MIRSVTILTLTVLLSTSITSQNQNKSKFRLVGGPCEGCEAVFEYGDRQLTSVDTLPDFNNEGQKLKLTGTIYQQDGKTPAKDVILYIYHTNQNGIYPTKGDEEGWAKRHGYLRGWVKTGNDGKYTFYTLKPGIYPSRNAPAHIHPTILEPDGKYYWIQDYYFVGDSLLTENELNPKLPRGGSSGLLNLQKDEILWIGERNIILGKNIPDYR